MGSKNIIHSFQYDFRHMAMLKTLIGKVEGKAFNGIKEEIASPSQIIRL